MDLYASFYDDMNIWFCWLQFSTDDLVKEVENSIAEFKRQKQEYDEERVREQVCTPSYQRSGVLSLIPFFLFCYF